MSAETIRRDLSVLESEGHLERTHGGAVCAVPGGRVERTLAARRSENVEAKSAIGRAALRLLDEIADGAKAAQADHPQMANQLWQAAETLREATHALLGAEL